MKLRERDGNVASLGEVDEFRGQDNPDGILFFAKHEGTLMGFVAVYCTKGQARGQYGDGRIDAVFSGEVSIGAEESCVASDARQAIRSTINTGKPFPKRAGRPSWRTPDWVVTVG